VRQVIKGCLTWLGNGKYNVSFEISASNEEISWQPAAASTELFELLTAIRTPGRSANRKGYVK